jgi:hypothetical protein
MKTFKVKKLTEGEHAGKHALFDGDEMVGFAELPVGYQPKDNTESARQDALCTESMMGFGVHGSAGSRLRDSIKARMAETGESQACAEANFIHTNEGRTLWEAARQEAFEYCN